MAVVALCEICERIVSQLRRQVTARLDATGELRRLSKEVLMRSYRWMCAFFLNVCPLCEALLAGPYVPMIITFVRVLRASFLPFLTFFRFCVYGVHILEAEDHDVHVTCNQNRFCFTSHGVK